MSTLQEKIMEDALGIKNENRVCSITQERVGGLFEDIGNELSALDAATLTVKNGAKSYTDAREADIRTFIGQVETGLHGITESLTVNKAEKTEVALKANSSSAMVELPSIGVDMPDSYTKRLGTWRANTANSEIRGRWVSFGDATEQYQLHFNYPPSGGINLELQGCSTNLCFSPVTIFHSGNTPQIVVAGRVYNDGNNYEEYLGGDYIYVRRESIAKYRVTHNLDTYRYVVNITPIGAVNRSFSVIKDISHFDVKFDAGTEFEFHILKY